MPLYSENLAKNLEKEGVIEEKGKIGKNREEKAKIGKGLSLLAPLER